MERRTGVAGVLYRAGPQQLQQALDIFRKKYGQDPLIIIVPEGVWPLYVDGVDVVMSRGMTPGHAYFVSEDKEGKYVART